MKILASLLVALALALALALAALAVWEVLWRYSYYFPGTPVASPSGAYIAQDRSLPEGSDLPYGRGVFVRRAGLPLWFTSRLVFAAYCKPEVELSWPAEKELVVDCDVAEGSVLQLPAPAGITVIHDSGA